MALYIRWIDYGKTFGELCLEETVVVEGGPTGLQVDFEGTEEDPALCPKGPHLVGDINAAGDISGEEYQMLTHVIVTRYRRVLTAEELKNQ